MPPVLFLLFLQAEGTSEQLREQTERRKKVFNAALKAAVSKIQSVSGGGKRREEEGCRLLHMEELKLGM